MERPAASLPRTPKQTENDFDLSQLAEVDVTWNWT